MTDPTPHVSARATLTTLAAFVIVVAGMKAATPIIVPFLLSIFIAIIGAPPLFWLEERGLPRALAMVVVIIAIGAAVVGLSLVVGASINDFSRDIPRYADRINDQLVDVVEWTRATGIPVPLTSREVLAYVNPGRVMQLVGDAFNGFGGVLTNTFLIFLTVVFILFETSSFSRKLRAVSADPEHSLSRFHSFTASLRRYLAIKSLASLGTGACVGLWLWALGIDYPVLWGLLAFLLNYVPNIGSIIAAFPALLLALVQLGPGAVLWAATGYLVINIFFGNIIEPRFMGRGLGLSALVVFLSLVFWGWVLGPVGMFLSVPLTMTAKIALDNRPDTRWLAVMLGTERGAPERAAPSED